MKVLPKEERKINFIAKMPVQHIEESEDKEEGKELEFTIPYNISH